MAFESISDLSKVPSGKVRLTTPHFVYQYLLQPVYAEFCQRYPNIQLEISISDAAIDILNEGFDLGIRFGDRVRNDREAVDASDEALFASPEYESTECPTPKLSSNINSSSIDLFLLINLHP